MVFVEIKSAYFDSFQSSPGMIKIIEFIINQQNYEGAELAPGSLEYCVNSLINSILLNDESSFKQIEDTYKRKKPESNSPWINNNYLIFFLLIGQEKFQTDKTWLKNALEVRSDNDNEGKLVLEFFGLIISKAIFQKGQVAPLQLVFIYLTEPTTLTTEKVDIALYELNRISKFPCFDFEFLNILYLGAFNAIIASKGVYDPGLRNRVLDFNSRIKKRISLVSTVMLYFILAIFFLCIFLFVKYVFFGLNDTLRNSITTVLGLLGVTFLEIFKGRKKIKRAIEGCINRILLLDLLVAKCTKTEE